ncbi:MAG: hypothetical protein H8E82_03280 [Candidatus Marinimicrobia bacterium]|nr:hypothetical protein [Candidatus Neomarinimicrobiota bacterium]
MSWLKHAFAVDEVGSVQPTETQKVVVDRVCQEIARRHLTTPALLFLETFRPLNFIGAQAMHFFHPIVSAILSGDGYRHFAEFLEKRGSVDYFCERIEYFEEQYSKQKSTGGRSDNNPKNETSDINGHVL